MDWLDKYLVQQNQITYPDWEHVYQYIDKHYLEEQQDPVWDQVIAIWTDKLCQELDGQYRKIETKNFIVITDQTESQLTDYLNYIEFCLKKILVSLKDIAYKYDKEKLVIIIADSEEDYYNYIAHYYPEGEHSLSSGCFLKVGVGHFIFPLSQIGAINAVTAHEMTHALVSHLQLPVWVDEGLATNIEDMICASSPIMMNDELAQKHISYWNDETVQNFWQGKSFSTTDDGPMLSYSLAQFLVQKLSRSYEVFANFCNEATFVDGGHESFINNFGFELGNLLIPMLGDGDWTPKPTQWLQVQSQSTASNI